MTNSKQRSGGNDAMRGISVVLIKILTVPAKVINFLTSPPGSSIILGFGVIYFALVSAEGYWQAMNSSNPAFMPKPFIRDGANFGLFLVAVSSPSFWMAGLVSLVIQGVQAFVLREYSIAKAKAEYDAVKGHKIPEPVEGQLDIAEYRRRKIKSIGMRTVRTRGALIALTYLCDIATSIWNYPLFGLSASLMFINFVWCLASIFGTESMINLFLESVDPSVPKTEVV